MSRFMCEIKDLGNYIGHYIAQEIYDTRGRLLVNINYQINERIVSAIEKHDVYCILISNEEIKEEVISTESRQIRTIEKRKIELRNTFHSVRDEILSNKSRSKKPSVFLNQETLKKVEKAVDSILEAIMANPFVAINFISLEDNANFLIKHSINVCYLGLCLVSNYRQTFNILRDSEKGIGRFDGKKTTNALTDLTSFGVSCFLHDIGKLPILDIIDSDKKYDNNHEAWEIIKKHPGVGYDMLFGKNINAHTLLGIKYHHENFDGTGYPYGIAKYKIHPYSRMIRIIDSFDAGMTKRPGREEKPFTEMLSEILALSGTHYDPEFSHLFIDMMLCGKSGLIEK